GPLGAGRPGGSPPPPRRAPRSGAAGAPPPRAPPARYPADAGLRSLVKDLRAISTGFAVLWDTGIVGVHETHTKTVHHPVMGTLVLDCDLLTAPGSDLRIVAYTAASGSDAANQLKLLGVIGTQALAEDGTPG
ncbi:transcriptional regulator, partial [Streptomyces sp. NPDC007000]